MDGQRFEGDFELAGSWTLESNEKKKLIDKSSEGNNYNEPRFKIIDIDLTDDIKINFTQIIGQLYSYFLK